LEPLSLKGIIQDIQKDFKTKDRVREAVLANSREAVRLSSQAILLVHRCKFDEARKKLKQVRRLLGEMEEALKDWVELAHGGAVYTAYQEFAEASIFLEFSERRRFLGPKSLGVPSIPYVLGLADVIGELRRMALDSIRNNDLRLAERCLNSMEDIYASLMTLENADALAPGLRRKCDVARHLIEATRGDVTIEARRSSLEQSIRTLEKVVEKKLREVKPETVR
jgi:translin